MHNYVDEITKRGFAVVENVIDAETVSTLLRALANTRIDRVESQRAGKAFGIRNLLNVVPVTRNLAHSPACKSLVEPILGSNARVVRGIYFDKHPDANWKVAWHQDLTIAVREKIDADGYGPWSTKGGIHHVQPPVSILENLLTIRLHLDDTGEANGALRVVPGTHQYGRLDSNQIENWKQRESFTCVVRRGGALVMRPLLLHSSMAAVNPTHRRVLHFEYSATGLPAGLHWFEAQR
jgi:ectoine hydroxylase-related dioxygenase (phytanoyl-CoA dioxygenase family)